LLSSPETQHFTEVRVKNLLLELGAQEAALSYFDILSRNASQGRLRHTITYCEDPEKIIHPNTDRAGQATRSTLSIVERMLRFPDTVSHFAELIVQSCTVC